MFNSFFFDIRNRKYYLEILPGNSYNFLYYFIIIMSYIIRSMEDLSGQIEGTYIIYKTKYEKFPAVLRVLRKMINSLKDRLFHREYIRGLIPIMKSITPDNYKIVNSQFVDYFNNFEY